MCWGGIVDPKGSEKEAGASEKAGLGARACPCEVALHMLSGFNDGIVLSARGSLRQGEPARCVGRFGARVVPPGIDPGGRPAWCRPVLLPAYRSVQEMQGSMLFTMMAMSAIWAPRSMKPRASQLRKLGTRHLTRSGLGESVMRT